MKKLSKKKRWILGTLGIFISVCLCWYMGIPFSLGVLECFPPPRVNVDGYATATAFTWEDVNKNGIMDDGEIPLAGVEIRLASDYSETDEDGYGSVEEFIPGCACRCWKGYSVEVVVLEGYRATIPISVEMESNDEVYKFGFVKD